MFELYPYFTNDGTVGLFSSSNDDIYHSTHGALSESWQKFIIPSNLQQYIESHNEVKILDICYGIGYNSKTALQVFVNSISKNSQKIKNPLNGNIDIEAIGTDNIPTKKSIQIDAVDTDKVLTKLSPFISCGIKNNSVYRKFVVEKYLKSNNAKNKLVQINKMSNAKIKPLPKEFRLNCEIPIIILKEMINANPDFLNDPILLTILNSQKYSPFLSQKMLNFIQIYQNEGCNYNKILNKTTFLHNIYYRYISNSYKRAENLLKIADFNLNFYNKDARKFILSTNIKYNFIFLDAFTPAKCPALWTVDFFAELFNKLEYDGVVLTYSNSAAVRNAMLQNGFSVGKILDASTNKFIGTIATKDYRLVEHGLDERDLSLIKSRAGICFKDEYLNLDDKSIIQNREREIEQSELQSSSQALKGDNSVEPV